MSSKNGKGHFLVTADILEYRNNDESGIALKNTHYIDNWATVVVIGPAYSLNNYPFPNQSNLHLTCLEFETDTFCHSAHFSPA